MVAVFAHGLAVIKRDVFGEDISPDRAAVYALYHDASEILTGDMPTPVKYSNPQIIAAYKEIEKTAADTLVTTLPEKLQPEFKSVLRAEDRELHKIVKAADKLSAYVKCLEELKTGNEEFRLAAKQTRDKLRSLNMPEVDYFMEHFIPSFEMTLDELKY